MSAVNTWNSSFNEAAETCGLDVAGVLAVKDGQIIGEWGWYRNDQRVQCANGVAIWTVALADIKADAPPALPTPYVLSPAALADARAFGAGLDDQSLEQPEVA